MKVCVISSLYPPYFRGGAVTVAENVVRGLMKRGIPTILITLGVKESKEDAVGVTIYRICPFNLFSFIDIGKHPTLLRSLWHALDTFNISSYFLIKRILLRERCDVVMTHNLKGIGYLIPKLLKKLSLIHIHTLHDIQLIRPSGVMMYGQEKPFLILDKIYERACRWLFGSPRVVISPSRWLLDFYEVRGFFYRSRRVVIQNPIAEEEIRPLERKEKNIINFLYLGQLESFKGIFFLIEVLKSLEKSNWKLRIVGNGAVQEEVKRKIFHDERFLFYGFMRHSKLSNVFRQTDCAIIPSLCYENSPTVIYESFAAGVPIIASDIGGIPELVKDQVNGFTFEPGDAKNLKKILAFYLEHPAMMRKLQENTVNTIRPYTTDKYMERIFTLLRES